jgi:uncharacterized protein YjbI with pentapeptide repeats
MKNKITKFFLATLVALPVFGNEHDYSYSEFTPFGKYMDLRGANFEGAQIVGSEGQQGGNFVRANLTGANLRDANFSRVNLGEANLSGADLNGTDFTDAIFNSYTKWPEGFDPLTIGAHGPGVDYSYNEFSLGAYHRDLTAANFEGAQIVAGNFVKANLTGANLRDANFSGVNLEFATLTGADLTGTNFTGVRFNSQTKWPEGFDPLTIGAHGPGVDYSYSEFTLGAYHRDLTAANFEGAQIVAGNFVKANLTGANLRDANFSGVNLEFATLTGADLRGTDLSEIKHNSHTKWTGAIYSVHTQWPEGFDPQAAGALLVEENQYANLEYAKFSDELVFTQNQLNILRNVGYEWGEELVTKGAMDQGVEGFHDIYGWAKPFEISENEETGIRELFWDNKEDKSTRYRRIFWKTKNPLQVGDILLARYSYLDGMVKENVENGGGAWLSKKEINRGTLSDEQSEGISGDLPYKHRFMLFQITGLNERFPDRIHLSFNGNLAPEGIRLAQWSVRKLIMGDSDGDGVNDAEEILVSGENPLKNRPTLDAPDKNPISNWTDYRKEWEKSRLKLNELLVTQKNTSRELEEKNAKIGDLVEKVAKASAELDQLKKMKLECMESKEALENELNEANQTLMARGEKVTRLKDELAQSIAMESSLKLEVESEAYKLEEKTAQYAQLETTLATPHIEGWHYTPTQGWLFTEVGTYPLVFAEQSQSWLYYDRGTSAPWWYFNYSNETWIDWKSE